ncbi:MAG: hypothetical protein LAT58_11035 [Opitutales bacterium]|nr:hypothetical protein [Opitutales bacterium]
MRASADEVTVTVEASIDRPEINGQPQSQTVTEGSRLPCAKPISSGTIHMIRRMWCE